MNFSITHRNKFRDDIIEQYKKYTTTISTPGMAASLECCAFLMQICEKVSAKHVLDLGSGFSSYSLRYFRKKYSKNMVVWSVDSDEEWLEKSKQFCKENSVYISNFKPWDKIKNTKKRFDLVFVDIDRTPNRPDYYKPLIENFTNDETIVVFDDMHKPFLLNTMYECLNSFKGYEEFDVRSITLEQRSKVRYCKMFKILR